MRCGARFRRRLRMFPGGFGRFEGGAVEDVALGHLDLSRGRTAPSSRRGSTPPATIVGARSGMQARHRAPLRERQRASSREDPLAALQRQPVTVARGRGRRARGADRSRRSDVGVPATAIPSARTRARRRAPHPRARRAPPRGRPRARSAVGRIGVQVALGEAHGADLRRDEELDRVALRRRPSRCCRRRCRAPSAARRARASCRAHEGQPRLPLPA